jgi:hypothetical protein
LSNVDFTVVHVQNVEQPKKASKLSCPPKRFGEGRNRGLTVSVKGIERRASMVCGAL